MVQATNGGRRWAPRAQRAGPKPHPPAPPWHALAPADVAERLGVDPDGGLTTAQVEAARTVHGLNLLPQPRPIHWPTRLLRSLRSPLILLLVAAAVLAWLSGHHTDSLAIAAVLVVNAAVGAWHEGRAERSMSALRHWDEVVVRVRRDHHDVDVPAHDLVPGDLVVLKAGDAVAADARLWQAARLQVSEAALTGESVPMAKDTREVSPETPPAGQSGMVFSGTFVTSGTATALVVATGSRSEFGRIAALAQTTRPPETPLEYRIRRFGRFLAMGAVLACAAVVLLGVLRRHPFEDISLLALGQLVSLVPEGLPVAVTIALAAGMQRMASHGALVRNLAAVETIGEATVVCTDKTGTLTRNEMTVHQAWVPSGRSFVADGTGYDPAGSVRTTDGNPAGDDPELLALAEGGLLCSDADLFSPTVPEGDWRIDGDPTEGALVVFAAKVGLDPDGHRQAHPRDAERPFDPEKQRMATRHRSRDGAVRVFVKGSPEALLLLLGDPDSPVAASARAAAEIMAGDGLRVLAVGVVAGDPWAHRVSGDLLAGHVHLLGLVGQIDRPRPEVPDAVRACHRAGIRVVMVTGDHLRTASAIAGGVGMLGQQDQAVDGTELSRWDDPTLDARIGSVAVFSRVSPGQKLRIVDAFQRRGELVAMTGDGVNDGPALARADVGVAMGTGGTDVARACADIVLVDNRFATLVEGIRQGRVVGENLRRVLLFVVSTSVDEVILVLLSLATGLPAPLTAVQILWVNLVTEATLTLNLVMDPPDEDVLARPPLPRNRPLVDRSMAWRIARMAASALAVCFVWFSSRILSGADLPSARAETFLLLVLCQWFHLLSAQSSTESALRIPWRTRPWLAGGLLLSVLLQAGAMALEPLPKVLGTAGFDPARLPWLIGAASVVLWIEEGRKAWNRKRNRPLGSPELPVSETA